MDEKKQYIQGSLLSVVSSINWGSWNVSPADEGGHCNKHIMQQYILLSQKNKQVTPNGKKSYTSQREIFK